MSIFPAIITQLFCVQFHTNISENKTNKPLLGISNLAVKQGRLPKSKGSFELIKFYYFVFIGYFVFIWIFILDKSDNLFGFLSIFVYFLI